MPVIVIGSPKGGCGKSTTAVLLGTELARGGAKVVMIDADPNQSLTKWSKADDEKPVGNITVVSSSEVRDRMENRKNGKFAESFDEVITSFLGGGVIVIVDLEGIADQKMADAIAVANLVIAPMNAASLDLDGAVAMVGQVRKAERHLRRPIAHGVLLNNLRGAAMGSIYKEIIEALNDAGIYLFKSRLLRRDAYTNLFREGGNLTTIDPKGNGNIEGAVKEASSFAIEIFDYMKAAVTKAREEGAV